MSRRSINQTRTRRSSPLLGQPKLRNLIGGGGISPRSELAHGPPVRSLRDIRQYKMIGIGLTQSRIEMAIAGAMIEIREATARDVSELARVHVKADWETYAPLFGAEAYMLNVADSEWRWRQALQDGGALLVATDDGAIVGLGHARADRIDALYLLAPYHRQGIGKAMLRRLLQALREQGVAEAKFDVVALNARAIAFYIALGARSVGRCVSSDRRGDTEDVFFVIATKPT